MSSYFFHSVALDSIIHRKRKTGLRCSPVFACFVVEFSIGRFFGVLLVWGKVPKYTFLLSYFSVKKSTKSQQGGLTPSSFQTTCGVHELVARSSAWRVRAALVNGANQ